MRETRSVEVTFADNRDGSVDWWVSTRDQEGQWALWGGPRTIRLRRGEGLRDAELVVEEEFWEAARHLHVLAGLLNWDG
jgi:hypothetical protein